MGACVFCRRPLCAWLVVGLLPLVDGGVWAGVGGVAVRRRGSLTRVLVGGCCLLAALCWLLLALLDILCGLSGVMGGSSSSGLNFAVLVLCLVHSLYEKVLAIFVRAAKKSLARLLNILVLALLNLSSDAWFPSLVVWFFVGIRGRSCDIDCVVEVVAVVGVVVPVFGVSVLTSC